MENHGTTERKSTDTIDERDVRALSEYLTVLPDGPDLFSVVSESGKGYTVDARQGVCSCPDHEYRGVECKHLRRVAFETGDRALPVDVDRDAFPADFGAHVEGKPSVVATDGGQIIEPSDGAEILEPDPEWTYQVEPPEQGGEEFVRCEGCAAEILLKLGGKSAMIHREGCPRAEGR